MFRRIGELQKNCNGNGNMSLELLMKWRRMGRNGMLATLECVIYWIGKRV